MRTLGIIGGIVVGLILIYLVVFRRPATVIARPVAASAGGGFWAGLGSLLGAGVGAAVAAGATKSSGKTGTTSSNAGGVLVVKEGLPGYGSTAVSYMPNPEQSTRDYYAALAGMGADSSTGSMQEAAYLGSYDLLPTELD